ncbi:MAG: chaperone modulator CbpM [Gammaproteobacteria bacterium]|nr:chaperone modulator CbpM [Gammaproteobacteria bacterium]
MSNETEIHIGVVLDDSIEFSLNEISRTCHVGIEVVIELVEVGIIEPRGREPAEWHFPGSAIGRIERALNLQRDLEINLPGVALVLELLDEIDHLKDRLWIMEKDW